MSPNQILAYAQPAVTCSKLTIKAPEQRHCRRSGVFIVNFEHISHLVLVFFVNFAQVNGRLGEWKKLLKALGHWFWFMNTKGYWVEQRRKIPWFAAARRWG